MAGGAEESPRQRMIGFMYLVLTALLALQVSSTVLEKFEFIDESLRQAIAVTNNANDKMLEGMAAKIKEDGNKASDLVILKKAEEAKKIGREMQAEIDKLREEVIKFTGGRDPETKSLIDGKNYDKSMAFLIGAEGQKAGKAYELQKKLNDFVEKINKLDTSASAKVEPFAFDGKDHPYFKNTENKGKDFALLNFQNTPLVAALAIMSEMGSKVAAAETKLVSSLSKQIGQVDVKFDKIMAMYTAESNTVAAGTKYRAQMFLAASASNITPRMSSSAGGVKVDENGVGVIEFTAAAGDYDKEGNAKKSWEGSITIKTARGTDTTFKVKAEYTVARPVIQIQSASVSALFLNCGNSLNIQVPALGISYNPSFQATGAEVIKGAQKGEVVVVPSAANVALSVFSDGNKIGTQDFKVKLLPKPSIVLQAGGRPLDFKTGGQCPASLSAVAKADPSIADLIPKDAKYRVTKWEVSLARGRRIVGAPKTVNSPDVNLNDFRGQAQPGDRLIIEVKEVQRMNFKGSTEPVKITDNIFNYSIN